MPLTATQQRERLTDRGETMTLTDVQESKSGYSLMAGSSGFELGREHGVVPKVGDVVTLYIHQGSMIHGIDLNGEPIYYKTRVEQQQEHEHRVEEGKRQRDEQFRAEREKLDAAFDALPEAFKYRIAWFRKHNPRFRQDYEAYELSACVDAVEIATWAESDENPQEAIKRFQKLPYETQQETIPGLAYDRHSGNSFGFAVRLAYHYVTDPALVYLEHGTMTPLVGCKDYGCEHPRDDEVVSKLRPMSQTMP